MADLPDMSAVRANLAFTCTHEADHLPPLDPEVDSIFQYGRSLEKKEGPKNFNEVARYYRIAAAHGHYKANHNLQLLVSEGSASSPDPEKESVALADQLIKAGVPSGYYDIGHYLLNGYGFKLDEEMARRFIRKAADLGNADAQYYVSNLLAPADNAPAIAKQMRRCAADQGHGQAASALGINYQNNSLFPEAVQAFQKGVVSGDSQSASFLENGFKGPPSTELLYYLAVSNDPERSQRYNLIGKFIDANDGRNPKVPDIDKIVPLPPAKLPAWDGTFQWKKEQDAAVPPPKPSDDLIERLSKAKNLDPATGLPLSPSASKTPQGKQASNVAARLPLGAIVRTGERCPENGVWCSQLDASRGNNAKENFRKGDLMPLLVVYLDRAAWLEQLIGPRRQSVEVAWKLVSYDDKKV
ncbi:Sel1-like repeat [Collimonas arenae]|uniref:Sel1-like repeat n=1 Tax=Collimonas arenae TaxID=279058 RepID=A0A0A1FCG9_9BURK|nr:Sel1-like repeat [Collimonas arenae]